MKPSASMISAAMLSGLLAAPATADTVRHAVIVVAQNAGEGGPPAGQPGDKPPSDKDKKDDKHNKSNGEEQKKGPPGNGPQNKPHENRGRENGEPGKNGGGAPSSGPQPEFKKPPQNPPVQKLPGTSPPSTKPIEKAPEEKKPEFKKPELKQPENKAPINKAPENKVPEGKVLENKVPPNKAPENKGLENKARENNSIENKAPEKKNPEIKGPEKGVESKSSTTPKGPEKPSSEPKVLSPEKTEERKAPDGMPPLGKPHAGEDQTGKKPEFKKLESVGPNGNGPPPGTPGFKPQQKFGVPGNAVIPPDARNLNDLKSKRREVKEDDGKRTVIEEPDRRRIIREDGRSIIRSDETERFRRIAPVTRVEKRNGLDISVSVLAGGIQIFTDLDERGHPLRRYRRGPDGRDIILFDNRDYYRRHREHGSFLDAIIDLPPPDIRIPRDRYVLDYERASDEDIYETLDAPPVDRLDRGYSLEEVRQSPMLRDRMRRIDLDAINFEFGSWTVEEDQYPGLERIARAMNRIIDRNPAEMFLIEGHTDAVGSEEDNLSLSDRRAEAVAVVLTEQFGVPPENLTTQGYGEQYLKVPTDGPERANRRVAVRRITPLLSREP